MKPLLKICGIKSVDELALLEAAGIDFAGIWFDIPAGIHCLNEKEIIELANQCSSINKILVTTSQNLESISRICRQTDFKAVQFHGFELPGFIQKARAILPLETQIFKTMHFKVGSCIEESFINRYVKAGVDVFILDSYVSQNQIGSTGIPIPFNSVQAFMAKHKGLSIMLAGGINDSFINEFDLRNSLYGYDIDSGARSHGRIDAEKVNAIAAAGLTRNDGLHQYG